MWSSEFFKYANTFYHSKDAFYHYNHSNENSATNNRRTTSKWSKWKENVDKMCSFMMAVDPINLETTCNYFKFDAKMFYMSAFDNTKEWFNLYRECHKDIMKFNEYSLRARLILKIILSNYLVFSMYKKLKTRKNSCYSYLVINTAVKYLYSKQLQHLSS